MTENERLNTYDDIINDLPTLRKITCKIHDGKHTWTASFFGEEYELDGRKTRKPDTKHRADTLEELFNIISL